eukprot:comp20378_c1_seq1/m.25754 comp20378_c1_seq1/g.25754  ORF comp20378_c1_seq1/g.25754 comp20378_c1_seq1/m.25754 type:complete len:119 (-) comp20378_c1_seq1:1265-1621(-)
MCWAVKGAVQPRMLRLCLSKETTCWSTCWLCLPTGCRTPTFTSCMWTMAIPERPLPNSLWVDSSVGALADKYGPRRMCLLYAVGYIVAACTKLINHYWVLMFGRIIQRHSNIDSIFGV